MASASPIKNKDGKVYAYQIKVFRGRDADKKQLKPFSMTWRIPDGMKHPKTIAAELERVKAEFENNCKKGFVALEKQTYESYSAYVLELKERDCKLSTYTRYKELNERIVKQIGPMKLEAITAEHLNRFYKKLGQDGANEHTCGKLSNKTIREYHNLIRVVLNQALRENLVHTNVATLATPPKVKKQEAEYFEPEDIDRILDALETEPLKWKAITTLMIATGARRGEILGLRWKDVDFKNNTVLICNNLLYALGKGTYEDTPKSGKSRPVPVDASVMQLLFAHKQQQIALRFQLGEDWLGDKDFEKSFCFTQADGKPMNPNSITDWLWKFSKKNNLPHIHPHAFRHTLASVLISEHVDPVTVSKWLGHQQVSTTQDIYAHMFRKANQEAADTVSKVLFHRKNA